METLLGLAVFALVGYVIFRYLRKKLRRKKALQLGRAHIHFDFPDVEGEHLFDIHMSGHEHYKDAGTPMANDFLIMKRDPENQFDVDAIKFINLHGSLVGWMPSNYNQDIAERMDSGEHFYGKVRKSIPRAGQREIMVSIYKSTL